MVSDHSYSNFCVSSSFHLLLLSSWRFAVKELLLARSKSTVKNAFVHSAIENVLTTERNKTIECVLLSNPLHVVSRSS